KLKILLSSLVYWIAINDKFKIFWYFLEFSQNRIEGINGTEGITIHVYSIGCNDFLFDIAHEEDIGFLAKNLDIGFIATLIIIEIMLEMIHPWKKKMTCSLSIVGNCLMRYFNVMNFI